MSYRILGDVSLDSGIVIHDTMLCVYYPSMKKIHSLKIPTDLFFYKDYEAYRTNKSRIYPVGKNGKPVYVFNMEISESEFSDRQGLTNEKIALKISDFLEDQFGNTNIRESDYIKYEELTVRIDNPVTVEHITESTSYESTSYESTSYETYYTADICDINEYEIYGIVSDKDIEIYNGTDLVFKNGELYMKRFEHTAHLTVESDSVVEAEILLKFIPK